MDHFADVTKYLSDIDPCREGEKTKEDSSGCYKTTREAAQGCGSVEQNLCLQN